ncbi:flagellin [Azospirillum halopraeferens]|uniref:flagellin n=1 Tax=Azospirillum halopraeferens TaxID=34010 RepID=UPI00040ED6E4|nr:flagellin [Azospirillum halopraeferens]
MERVATAHHQSQLVRYMLKAEANTATAQVQAATGLKSTDYKGIADDSGRLINLESYYRRSERYVDEGEVVNGRIQAMHSAVGGMIDLTNRVEALVTSLQGAAGKGAEGIRSEAAALLEEFAALLNTQLEGRYLFAGAVTDRAPVSVNGTVYPPPPSPSSPDTGYYSGDGTIALFRASDDLILEYGVTADNPAIEKALRAINLLATMPTDPIDTDRVNEAAELADAASDALTVVQTRLGATSATLERTIDRHLEEQLVLETRVDDVRAIDLAEAATRASQLRTSLEATLSLIRTLETTNLLKYL